MNVQNSISNKDLPDPRKKPNIPGAFCRTYGIEEAMAKFIPNTYTPFISRQDSDDNKRYSYANGTSKGGAVVYSNLYLYSFHSSDPCAGKMTNSFDMVRKHKFAHLDTEAKTGTPINKMPSYLEMCRLASGDTEVASEINKKRVERLINTFSDAPGRKTDWLKHLTINPVTGKPERTIRNILTIFENDSALNGKLVFDEFANRGLASGALPWNESTGLRDWTDVDDKGLRDYLEYNYHIAGANKIDDAVGLYAHKNTINDIKEYLCGLKWDGKERVDKLFIEYLGAADNQYTRAVARKSLTAAVARTMTPGVKYDWVPILVGPQGIGKSTLLRLLGLKWYSDSLTSFEGKEASEMIQGTWINELGELSTLNRSEINIAKQFISRTEDIYREPFGKRTNRYPRRCVFFGTSNENEFLRDSTGERRFWPITCMVTRPNIDIFKELEGEVDQIWAEAYVYWQSNEPLHLSPSLEEEARKQQELYSEGNVKEGIIREFIEQEIPLDWHRRTLEQRRAYWRDENGVSWANETMPRKRICAAEIWCECFGTDIRFIKRIDAIEINRVLSTLEGWRRYQGRFGIYNQQKGYERCA